MAKLNVSLDVRRARLARRQCLFEPASAVEQAAERIVAFHGTDPTTVYLSAWARTGASVAAIESALYSERRLLRVLVMRQTVFLVPLAHLPMTLGACTVAIAPKARKRLLKLLADVDVGAPLEPWFAQLERDTVAAVREAGQIGGAELAERVPALQTEFAAAPGKSYDRRTRITTRVLNLLAAQGHLVRAQPTGALNSSRYQWALFDDWAPEPVAIDPPVEARANLVRAYLDRFGPVTTTDIKWWTGFTLTATRKALATLGAVEVALDDGTGWLLPDDPLFDGAPAAAPHATLLPALDPTPMGYKERAWFLGDHESELFDYSGNIGATVWVDGRVVGVWVQRPEGPIQVEWFESVRPEAVDTIQTQAAALETWLGDVRVRPRFPTPKEKALLRA